jgi:hypothetical protein
MTIWEQLHNGLNVFLKLGGLAILVTLARWVASKIPQNTQIHGSHATVAVILQTAVDAGERLIKAVLTGPYLQTTLDAVAGGTALKVALKDQLPTMVQDLRTAIGPKAAGVLDDTLGAAGSQKQLEGVALANAGDHLRLVSATAAPVFNPPPTPPALPAKAS